MARRHMMLLAFVPVAIVVLALMNHQAPAGNLPNPNPPAAVEVIDWTYGGSGCPTASATLIALPDQNALSILFDDYHARSPLDSRKSCQMVVALRIPAGISIARLDIDYHGSADIPAGSYGRLDAFLLGHRFWRYLIGPVFGDVLASHGIPVSMSCADSGIVLRHSTSIQVGPRTSEAALGVDRIDYRITWQPCPL